jgi:hypothetical protein
MTNVDQIPMKVLNVKLKGNCPSGRQRSRCEQPVRQYVTQEDSKKCEDSQEKLWEDQEIYGEAWLVEKPHVSPWLTTKEDVESSTYHTNQYDVYHKQQKLYNS